MWVNIPAPWSIWVKKKKADRDSPIFMDVFSSERAPDVDRDVDMWVTGGRHPFLARLWTLGMLGPMEMLWSPKWRRNASQNLKPRLNVFVRFGILLQCIWLNGS